MGTDGTFTIRTSTGQLFGSFKTREAAWAAVQRVIKRGHPDVVDGAAVVPLLAGVEPKPVHPAWLSDDAGEPSELEQLRAERDRYREHSITLNSVSFAMAEALGDVAPGADSAEGHPEALVARLVGTLAYRQTKCEGLQATLDRRTAQLDEAYAEVERLTDRLREAQDRPWQNVSGAES